MQPRRFVAALIAAPIVAAAIYVPVDAIQASAVAHGANHDDPVSVFIGAAVLALVFELVILLPAALLLRRNPRFAPYLAATGIVSWLVLTAGGLAAMGRGASAIAATTAQFLAVGVPLVLVFTLVLSRGMRRREPVEADRPAS